MTRPSLVLVLSIVFGGLYDVEHGSSAPTVPVTELAVAADPLGACKLKNPEDTLPLPPVPTPQWFASLPDTLAAEGTSVPKLSNRGSVGDALEREYPVAYRSDGRSWAVKLALLIDRAGRVPDIAVLESSGEDELDRAAIRIGCVMRFSPAKKAGVPVPVWVGIPITFTSR